MLISDSWPGVSGVRALCLSPPEVIISLPPGLNSPEYTHRSLITPSAVPHGLHMGFVLLSVPCVHVYSLTPPLSLPHHWFICPSCFPDCLSLFRLLCFLFWACLCPVCTSLSPCPPAILCPVYVLFSVFMLLFPLRGGFICVSVYFVIYKLKKHHLPAFESSSLPACDRTIKPGTIELRV